MQCFAKLLDQIGLDITLGKPIAVNVSHQGTGRWRRLNCVQKESEVPFLCMILGSCFANSHSTVHLSHIMLQIQVFLILTSTAAGLEHCNSCTSIIIWYLLLFIIFRNCYTRVFKGFFKKGFPSIKSLLCQFSFSDKGKQACLTVGMHKFQFCVAFH